MTIEVNNESGVDVDELAISSVARHALDSLGVNPLAELSILVVDTEAMSTLHKQWMDLDGPTDVMSFPMDTLDDKPGLGPEPGPALLGDVVLCPEVAAAQAEAAGHTTAAELYLLTTHGVLHLLGYDHGEPDEEREMFTLQTRLVTEWGDAHGVSPIRSPLPGTGGELRS
ncbi:rRNA maturation RNase YbeY [Jatrophihabitans telluris]|uniref:Endoribonuclease YbeY n=1 Tax=Jatrophihabitans telluris TaxID=2038343 RepID=A0ABY4QW29_9ACTN|nr:rRNA maturation RNase YbeY [Jatrophihabitans telluris]UQX87494.1 rRNA maturation RNase YbeY [Jatrophihabitans telluris]